MRTSELDYELPPELIAQRPLERRDESRLLVYDRVDGGRGARPLPAISPPTLPARRSSSSTTRGSCPRGSCSSVRSGGGAEVLLLEASAGDVWEALARPSRRLRPGMTLGRVELARVARRGSLARSARGRAGGRGALPPYITEPLEDPERYQTVYAEERGSAAAPTAGLHFTPELIAALDVERVTLHVGLDTFRPVTAETLDEHGSTASATRSPRKPGSGSSRLRT